MRILAPIFALAIVAGCKSGPIVVTKDAPPPQLPAGAKSVQSTDGKVSVMVPSGWRRGTPNSIAISSFGGLGESGESMAEPSGEPDLDPSESAELEKKGILIWVNDSSRPIPGEERTSYRIKRTDDGPKSLEDAAADAKQDLINEGPVQYVELPVGKAARLEAKNTKVDGGELFQIVYILVNGEHIYNVKFTTQNAPSQVQQVEKEVMDSLRIKPAKAS